MASSAAGAAAGAGAKLCIWILSVNRKHENLADLIHHGVNRLLGLVKSNHVFIANDAVVNFFDLTI